MAKEERDPKADEAENSEIERDARSQVEFSLAKAIGNAGAELLKGASPVTRKRQAVLLVEQFMEAHLDDDDGAIQIVLSRAFRESEALLENSYDDPMEVLASIAGRVLRSENALRQLVRAVDTEWGRMYLEKPYFEREGKAPHPDDPYTVESVRASLHDLVAKIGSLGDPTTPAE